MPALTLSMIVKNEEKYLRGCLESVKSIVDEIIIVDTGSTDKTIDIAKEFGAKIFNFKWIKDFSAARNFALKKSTGKWIIYLDADERLDEDSIDEVKSFIKLNDKVGCFCAVHSIDTGNGSPNVMNYPRLFKNSGKIYFAGRIHEQIIDSLKKERYKLYPSNIKITHLGYNISLDDLRLKAKRNLDYLLEEYKTKKNPYIIFQIAQTYGVLGERQNGAEWFKEVIKLKDSECPKFYKGHAYRYNAINELTSGNTEIALEFALKGQKYDSSQPILHKVTSEIYFQLKKYPLAVEYAKKAYDANKTAHTKEFEIMLHFREIYLNGLMVSTFALDKASFNFFYENYFNEYKEEVLNNSLIQLIKRLMNNEVIEDVSIGKMAEFIDSANFLIVFKLIEKYAYKETAITLLRAVKETIKNNFDYYKLLGNLYSEINNNLKACEAFEKALNFKITDPSILFFLISIYINLNKLEKISEILTLIENRFAASPEVISKLEIIKSKLKPILIK